MHHTTAPPAELSVSDIERTLKITLDAGHYAGRSPGDFNNDTLTKIRDLLEKRVNARAADSFVQMIAYLPHMSASLICSCLTQLMLNDWIWKEQLIARAVNEPNAAQALSTIRKTMELKSFGPGNYLRRPFLQQHLPRVQLETWLANNPY